MGKHSRPARELELPLLQHPSLTEAHYTVHVNEEKNQVTLCAPTLPLVVTGDLVITLPARYSIFDWEEEPHADR